MKGRIESKPPAVGSPAAGFFRHLGLVYLDSWVSPPGGLRSWWGGKGAAPPGKPGWAANPWPAQQVVPWKGNRPILCQRRKKKERNEFSVVYIPALSVYPFQWFPMCICNYLYMFISATDCYCISCIPYLCVHLQYVYDWIEFFNVLIAFNCGSMTMYTWRVMWR